MRLTLCAFVAGCWLVQQLPALPPPAVALVGLACALAIGCGLGHWRRCLARRPAQGRQVAAWLVTGVIACAAGGAAGAGWAAYRASGRLADRLPPALESTDLQLSGTVASLPAEQSPGLRFVFTPVFTPEAVHRSLPERILLSWQAAPADLLPGDRLTLTARLRRPHGLANRYGFDQEYWLLQRGIGAVGHVRKGERLPTVASWRHGGVARLRARLRQRLRSAMPSDASYAGVLVALAIGDQGGITPSQWRLFNRSGIGHLISISGLHITMVSGLAAAAVRLGWRRSFGLGRLLRRPLPLRCPAQHAAACAAVLTALCHGLVSGMEVPAQRTVTMVATAALALWLHRTPPASLVLAWAAAAALAIDPWAARSAGFWLSFGAVASIFLAVGRRGGKPADRPDAADVPLPGWGSRIAAWARAAWHEAVHVQWAVTVGLIAPTLVLFQQLSLVSPLANAVAIPLVSLLVTPAVLLATALVALAPACAGVTLAAAAPHPLTIAGTVLLGGCDRALRALESLLTVLAAPDWAVWQAASPGPLAVALAVPGTLVLLAPAGFGWRLRLHGLLLLGPLLAAGRSPPAQGFRATAFDVGQGAAVLIETRRHLLLYDAGPSYGPAAAASPARPGRQPAAPSGVPPPRFAQPDADGPAPSSAGERVVLPFLRASGIRHLDALVISHEDADHAGGARAVLGAMPVARLWSGAPLGHPLLRAPPGHAAPSRAPCAAGMHWEWDGVRFAFLHPAPGQAGQSALPSNARSCVLHISSPAGSMLLAGDIDAASERAMLLRLAPEQLRADLLLVPHHGSISSSTAGWLDAVRPAGALFQLGYRNRYRHPHPRVWARYGVRDIARWRTDSAGMLSAELVDGGSIAVRAFRQTERRYWREAPPMPE
ncbi:DNA internalization-related competence protein ComEC/Rec2 [Cupriavidus sp. AU9028]|uniref:DNA internalization-related competence protein ComEC/Rec2 n=1 Tax=Cupriavidus sp. AU9028 TaxID=2871157 RepID=UPI001C97354E|nr:DNA internalization-related competence protein ComEC/Rec2 [Cupriavidus sp. AU9028]MBY4898725.1 DNA internalization-related competence protein ComEC/Rec2 [Cupriavidus sp. AU9028]